MSRLYIGTKEASEASEGFIYDEEEIILDNSIACPDIGELVKVYSEEGHLFSGVVKSIKFFCYSTDPLDSEVSIVLKKSRKLRHLNFYDPGDGDGNYPVFRREWFICAGGDNLVLTFYKDNYKSFLGQALNDLPPNVGWTVVFQNDDNERIQGKVIERVWLINHDDQTTWEIAVLLDGVSNS